MLLGITKWVIVSCVIFKLPYFLQTLPELGHGATARSQTLSPKRTRFAIVLFQKIPNRTGKKTKKTTIPASRRFVSRLAQEKLLGLSPPESSLRKALELHGLKAPREPFLSGPFFGRPPVTPGKFFVFFPIRMRLVNVFAKREDVVDVVGALFVGVFVFGLADSVWYAGWWW